MANTTIIHPGDLSVGDNCNPRLCTLESYEVPLGSVPWDCVRWWSQRPSLPDNVLLRQHQQWGRAFGPSDLVFALVESLPRHIAAPHCERCPEGQSSDQQRSVNTHPARPFSDDANERLWNLGADDLVVTIANNIHQELWERFRSNKSYNGNRCAMNGGCASLHSFVALVRDYRFPTPKWEHLTALYHVKRVSRRQDVSEPYPELVNVVGKYASAGFATALADGIIIPVGAKSWLEGRDSSETCLGAGWRAVSDYRSYQPAEDPYTRMVIEAASIGEAARMEVLIHASESELASEGIGSKDELLGAALRRLVESHTVTCSFRHDAPRRTWLLGLLWIAIHDLADLRADFANKNPDNLWLWWDTPHSAAVTAIVTVVSIIEHHGWSWWHHAAYALYHVWHGRRYNLDVNAGIAVYDPITCLTIPSGVPVNTNWDGIGTLEGKLAAGFIEESPVYCGAYWKAAIDLWNAQCGIGFGGLDLDAGSGETKPWGHG